MVGPLLSTRWCRSWSVEHFGATNYLRDGLKSSSTGLIQDTELGKNWKPWWFVESILRREHHFPFLPGQAETMVADELDNGIWSSHSWSYPLACHSDSWLWACYAWRSRQYKYSSFPSRRRKSLMPKGIIKNQLEMCWNLAFCDFQRTDKEASLSSLDPWQKARGKTWNWGHVPELASSDYQIPLSRNEGLFRKKAIRLYGDI